MQWTDHGFVLTARRHGEDHLLLICLTATLGVRAGLVRHDAQGRAMALCQPGNFLHLRWQARDETALGSFTLEPVDHEGSRWFDDPRRLAVLSSLCAMTAVCLPERDPVPGVWSHFAEMRAHLAGPHPEADYVLWEIAILAELGYGLDLSRCAATGQREDLRYLSPRTGRAISATAGAPYAEKLFSLPKFFLTGTQDAPSLDNIRQGLKITGFFLDRWVLSPHHRAIPPARRRLAERLATPSPPGAGSGIE